MQKDTATLFVRMPADLHQAIKQAADREDRTVSQFIRQTMRERTEPEKPARRRKK